MAVRRSHEIILGFLLFMIGVVGAAMWFTGGSIVLDTLDEVPEVAWGADIRSASVAGTLALDRDAVALYEEDHGAYLDESASRYVYPPWYAVLMIPLSVVPFPAVYFLWSMLGVGLLVWSSRLLEIRMPALISAVVLATWAAVAALWYGQNSFVLLAVLALGLHLSLAGRNVSAGIAMALCAFKPHLLLGFGILWLADLKRWSTVLVSAAGATVLLAAASELWIPGAWSEFIRTIFGSGVLVVRPEREVALLTTVNLLLPSAGSVVWVIWGVAATAVAVSFVATIRRWQGHKAVPAALAIVVSLLLSLHGLAYDWVILVAAFGLLDRYGGLPRSSTTTPFLLLAALLPVGLLATDAMFDRFGWAIHTPPLALLAVYIWFVAAIWRRSSFAASASSPETAVGTPR